MGNRKWKYLKKRQKLKERRRAIIKFRTDVFNDLVAFGMVGTRVWKDENGDVKIKTLSYSEIIDFYAKGGNDEEISIAKL